MMCSAISRFTLRFIPVIILLFVASIQALAGQPVKSERIDPAGIPGSLVICGQGNVPAAVIDHFLDLANGKKGRIVVVRIGKTFGSDQDIAKTIFERAEAKGVAALTILRMGSKADASQKETLQALDAATGVWIMAEDQELFNEIMRDTLLAEAVDQLTKRRAVVAGRRVRPAMFGISDVQRIDKGDKVTAGKVGFDIDADTALVVRGRRLYVLGNGNARFYLAPSKTRKAKTVIVTSSRRSSADLTALRRSALARTQPPFPPKEIVVPEVKNGTLVIIGGGGMPKGMIQKIVDLAGGKKAKMVIFPTAMPDPISKRSSMALAFKKAGAAKVTVLPQRKLKDVESKEFLDTLKEATGIWFGGGRQWRFADAYLDTKAHKLMHDVLKRGGVAAGSSAGASIQGEYLARANPLGNLDIMAEGYERGLGFIKGVAIDQHFARRKRFKDMTGLIKTYPQLLGIGIDEATAIIVKGHVAEVVGRAKTYFYDAGRKIEDGAPDYEAVGAGGRYDLKERRVLLSAD